MNFFNIVLCATIYLIKNISSGRIHSCMELSGNPGMRVGVYYNDDLSFIPKKIFIRYEMNGETWQKDENKVQKIDLRAIDGYCESDGIILPRLNKAAETVIIIITVFSDESEEVIIDHFEVRVAPDYVNGLIRIEGLVGVMDLNVQLSPDIQKLKFGRDSSFKYSQSLGKLKNNERLCLKLFKTGGPVVVKVKGAQLSQRDIYDRYHFEIYVLKDSVEYARKVFLAEGYVCAINEQISAAEIYVGEYLKRRDLYPFIKISIKDGSGLPPLSTVMEPTEDYIYRRAKTSDVVISPLNVQKLSIQSAMWANDGINIYPLTNQRYICEEKYGSFVELHKVDTVVVETRSKFVDPTKSDKQVTVMFSGIRDQIDKCLHNK